MTEQHQHYLEKCRLCGDIIRQCRCMGPKDETWGVCPVCKADKTDRLLTALRTKPPYHHLTDEYEPTNETLWERVMEVAGGRLREYTVLDRTIHAPNRGRGFIRFPNNPKAMAWVVKQYKGFGGKFRGKKEAMESWTPRLRRMASGGVEVTESEEETKQAQMLEREGLIRLASTVKDRHYWEVTAKGVTAGLKQDLLSKLHNLEALKQRYSDDQTPLTYEDKKALSEFGSWLKKNFRIDSAKGPKALKGMKESVASMASFLEEVSKGGTVYSSVLDMPSNRFKVVDVDALIDNFSVEGDVMKGKTVLTEIKGAYATYINNATMSNDSFEKYVKSIETTLSKLKGWQKKALSGNPVIVFVARSAMKPQGKYRREKDEMWVRATPEVLKRADGYGSFAYILVHELGHRYEKFHKTPIDFERHEWRTTRYSHNDGEAFAELFALAHFDLTGTWDKATVEKFENVMSGKPIAAGVTGPSPHWAD